jgi:hypothetical protein
MSDEDAGGFLARWSRRKRAARGEAGPTVADAGGAAGRVAPAAGDVATGHTAAATKDDLAAGLAAARAAGDVADGRPGKPDPSTPRPGDVALPAEATPDLSLLPKIEDLTAASDIAPFLARGVPAALRNAALKRIWALDPVIRDFVGPADYAWDFNAPDGVPGFSLELGGDPREMLKRLLGVDREEAEAEDARALAAEGGAPPAEARPQAAEPGAAPVRVAEPSAGAVPGGSAREAPDVATAPGPGLPPAATPAFVPPAFLPPGQPAVAGDAPAAGSLRRRHGSARPA